MASNFTEFELGKYQGREGAHLLVVGCGNPMAGDDSAGVEIVRRLRGRRNCACQLSTTPNAGIDLLDGSPAADVILFVDAVSSGAPPGALHLVPLPSQDIEPRMLSSVSSHGWGLAETLELARALGRTLPRLFLLGVEVSGVEPGAPRSPAVEHAIAFVVDQFPRMCSALVDSESALWHSAHHFLPGDNSFPQ